MKWGCVRRAGRASSTAYLIAGSTVYVARERAVGHLVPERAAELCARFVAERPRLSGRVLRSLSAGRLRPLGALVERLTVPGIRLHYALRKRFVEDETRAAVAEGFAQVVVLGAGFDTLAPRLADEFARTRFLEVDRPATQRLKRDALARASATRSNLFFLPLDLAREGLRTALLSSNTFRRDSRTLFVAEGLLMYLAPREVGALLGSLRAVCDRPPRLVFTFIEPRPPRHRLAFHNSGPAVSAWLALRGEPFRWGATRERLAEQLAAHGLRARGFADAATLRRRYLSTPALARLPLAEGESLCVAEAA